MLPGPNNQDRLCPSKCHLSPNQPTWSLQLAETFQPEVLRAENAGLDGKKPKKTILKSKKNCILALWKRDVTICHSKECFVPHLI